MNRFLKDDGRVRIGYARVSCADQNLDMQVSALDAAGCTHIFTDKGVSGGTVPNERAGYQAAMSALSENAVLVVWKMDRLGRSLKSLIETIDGLQTRGVEFVSLTESIDTTNATGRAFWQFIGLMAELERGLIRERTLEGLEAARKRGAKLGRPRKLDMAQVMEARDAIRVRRHSYDEVAMQLGVSSSTVRRVCDSINVAHESSTSIMSL